MSNNLTFFESIVRLANKHPEKKLITVANESLTYKEVKDYSENLAGQLIKLGIKPEDKVLIILPNSIQWYLCFSAVSALGAIPVPLDPQVGSWELKNYIDLLTPTLVISCSRFRAVNHEENIQSLNAGNQYKTLFTHTPNGKLLPSFTAQYRENKYHFEQKSSNTLMLASTSGTTGNPKVIEVPHIGFLNSQKDMANYLCLNENDSMLLGMPLFHQGGFGMGLQATLNGCSVSYLEQFTQLQCIETIEKSAITVVQLSPTLAKFLIATPEFTNAPLPSLRLAYFAGERLDSDTAKEFYEHRKIQVVNVVGSTETGTMVVWNSFEHKKDDPSTLYELPFAKVKIVDDAGRTLPAGQMGELLVNTEGLLTRYYGNPDATKEKIATDKTGTNWFHTGDLGMTLESGAIEYKGRKKRAIKRGANLVYPEELESFLNTHNDIIHAVILGEKDPLFGEKVVAMIEVKKDKQLSRGAILQFCRGKVASYKIPDEVQTIEKIPTHKGKIDFKQLKIIREQHCEIS